MLRLTENSRIFCASRALLRGVLRVVESAWPERPATARKSLAGMRLRMASMRRRPSDGESATSFTELDLWALRDHLMVASLSLFWAIAPKIAAPVGVFDQ